MRACVRACEAVRVREGVLLNAGGSDGKKSDSGAGCPAAPFAAISMGFKAFS